MSSVCYRKKSLNRENSRGKYFLKSLGQFIDQENNLIQVYKQQMILATSQIWKKKVFCGSIALMRLKHTITQDGPFLSFSSPNSKDILFEIFVTFLKSLRSLPFISVGTSVNFWSATICWVSRFGVNFSHNLEIFTIQNSAASMVASLWNTSLFSLRFKVRKYPCPYVILSC